MDDKPEVTIYVDGACLGNPGDGGWGALLKYGQVEKWFSGFIPDTTNNRAELIAIIEALMLLKTRCKVTLYSDSQVTVRCASGEYSRKANRDLWDRFEALDAVHEVRYVWIRGHDGNLGNERAHRLADRAARKLPML